MTRRARIVLGASLIVTVLCGAELRAAPFRPASDDVVVEVLPPTAGLRRLELQVPATPGTWNASTETRMQQQVRELILLARRNGDPRQLGRAEALLRSAPQAAPVPIERALLQATIDQSLHRFDAALRGLDGVLARDPANPQARLTRATVLQVRGQYDAAARDCAALARNARPLVARTCSAAVASLRGRAREAFVLLDFTLRSAGRDESDAVLAWSHTVLASIAERSARPDAAEQNYRAALALDDGDPFARASYADLLLDLGRPREALELVAGRRSDDNLLLREVLARRALRDPAATPLVLELGARFDVAHQRGDGLHLREEARFELHVVGDAQRAANLARSNWQVQREPADARILREAAVADNDAVALRLAGQWYATTGVAAVVTQPTTVASARAGDRS